MTHITRCLALSALVGLGTGCENLPPAPDVPNQPPTASFYFTPVAPIWAGQTAVSFSAINARDPDGRVMSYVWNFGDGTPEETTNQANIRHTFPDTPARCLNVTYGVLLSVVDDKGDRGAASLGVTVIEAPAPTAPECQAR